MAGYFTGNRVNITSWVNLSPVTICFWFNLNSPLKALERMIGSDDNWEVRVTQDWTAGSYRIANELFASGTSTPSFSTTVVVANTWYFVAASATFNVSSALYVNGLLESTSTCVDSPTGTTLSIGGRNTAVVGDGLNGVLDDVRVYNRILTDNEVATIYACKGVDRIYDGLVNRWLLNEGADGVAMSGAGSVKDIIGLKNGTPSGAAAYRGSFLKKRPMTTWQ
jgi:hypothetical protein